MLRALILTLFIAGAQALTTRNSPNSTDFAKHPPKSTDPFGGWPFGGSLVGTPKVLLFWAVNSEQNTKDLVKAGVDAFKRSGVKFDLFLAHYDQGQGNWDPEGDAWYKNNVKWSSNYQNWKLHLLKWEIDNQKINHQLYDYVWALDNDIDLGSTDIKKLFAEAKASDALVIAPSMVQVGGGGEWQEPHWPANKAQENCRNHHVPLIEITMPIIRKDAFAKWQACGDCLGNWGDWGPDMMWCGYLGRETDGRDRQHACSVLDQVSVVHRNYQASGGQDFHDAMNQVRDSHWGDWNMDDAYGVAAYDCVQADGKDGGMGLMKFGGMPLHGLETKPQFDRKGRDKNFANKYPKKQGSPKHDEHKFLLMQLEEKQ